MHRFLISWLWKGIPLRLPICKHWTTYLEHTYKYSARRSTSNQESRSRSLRNKSLQIAASRNIVMWLRNWISMDSWTWERLHSVFLFPSLTIYIFHLVRWGSYTRNVISRVDFNNRVRCFYTFLEQLIAKIIT